MLLEVISNVKTNDIKLRKGINFFKNKNINNISINEENINTVIEKIEIIKEYFNDHVEEYKLPKEFEESDNDEKKI